MIEVLAKTRRQLNRLQQVKENQGDLEERIASDIANLKRQCKELQNTVDHESLRAMHECNGMKNSLTADLSAFSKATSTHFAVRRRTVYRTMLMLEPVLELIASLFPHSSVFAPNDARLSWTRAGAGGCGAVQDRADRR